MARADHDAADARAPSSRRDELVAAADLAGRELGAAAVLFHSAMAATQGLNATEEKAIDLLQRFGPLTAGELSQRSGLAPASVTGLVNRLEAKGFARRVPHPTDRRSVLVELRQEALAPFVPLYTDFVRSLHELYERYTDEQLELIIGFMREAARRQREATAKLTGNEPG